MRPNPLRPAVDTSAAVSQLSTAPSVTTERSASFSVGDLFYRPNSRLIRDLGVLALTVLGTAKSPPASSSEAPALQVLDAMSGTGVRALRYVRESPAAVHVHANELMFGDHPLVDNMAPLVAEGRATVTACDAVDLYLRSRLSGERFDMVDADAFGTGMPHTAEAWWAVKEGGLLYLCATDSCTTCGHNAHKATAGYAAVAHALPAANEQGLRLLLGAAFREAAARHLHAVPVFSYFHRPSSSFRVMLKLHRPKRPPARAYDSLCHVARCTACGQQWRVPSTELGEAAARRPCAHLHEAGHTLMGPMWVGPMHDAEYVQRMAEEAERRGEAWDDAAALLRTMASEAEADAAAGAVLHYHLGEVQRYLQAEAGLEQPPLAELVELLRAAGFGASPSHTERKAIKTSATLEQLKEVVQQRAQQEQRGGAAEA